MSEPLQPRDEEIARFLFDNDRDLTKKLLTHNELGKDICGWSKDDPKDK